MEKELELLHRAEQAVASDFIPASLETKVRLFSLVQGEMPMAAFPDAVDCQVEEEEDSKLSFEVADSFQESVAMSGVSTISSNAGKKNDASLIGDGKKDKKRKQSTSSNTKKKSKAKKRDIYVSPNTPNVRFDQIGSESVNSDRQVQVDGFALRSYPNIRIRIRFDQLGLSSPNIQTRSPKCT